MANNNIFVNYPIKSLTDTPVAYGEDLWYSTQGEPISIKDKIDSITGGTTGPKGDTGRSIFTSMVFKRSNNLVNTPSGGDFNHPVPEGWDDGIPSGVEKIWMSKRIFTSDGQSPQNDWSVPEVIASTSDIEYMFSTWPLNPGTPTSDPSKWSETAVTGTIWMAIRKTTNGIISSWSVTQIKGEKGDTGTTITPSFRINPVTNYWEVSTDGGSTWTSMNQKATGDNGDTPDFKIENKILYVKFGNGSWVSLGVVTGQDGKTFEMIFYLSTTTMNPLSWEGNLPNNNWDYDSPVSPWFDDAQDVDSLNQYQYFSYRWIIPGSNPLQKGNWSYPKIWNMYSSNTISQSDVDAIITAAEAAATAAVAQATFDLTAAEADIATLKSVLGESGGVYTAAMAWNNTTNNFEQYVGEWDVTGASGSISTFIQGTGGLEQRVSKQNEDLIGVSKLLVGADGLYAGVSDLATAAGMTAGDIKTAQQEMKSDIISQTVAAGAVMVNKYGHYCTDDTQHYAIIWNESQDEVAYYDEATEKFYEIQPNGYSEISAPAKWHYINKDDAEFYDYVTVNADKMSNITQTSSEIKAVVANFEEGGAASWVLSPDSFKVIADNIDLNGKVTAKSVYATDSYNSDIVSINEGDISLIKDSETVVSINNDVIDDSRIGMSVKKVLGGNPQYYGDSFGPIGLHIKGNLANDGTRTGRYYPFSITVDTPKLYASFKFSGTSFTLDSSQSLFEVLMSALATNGNGYVKPLSFYNNHIELNNTSYVRLYYGRNVSSYTDCQYLTWTNKKVISTSTISDEGKTFSDVLTYINSQNGNYKFYVKYDIQGKLYQTYYNTDGGSLETSYYPKISVYNESITVTDDTTSEYASVRIGQNGMLLDLGKGVYVSMSQHNGNPYIKLMSKISDTNEKGFLLTKDGKVYYCNGNQGSGTLARLISVDSNYQTSSGHSAAPSAGSTAYGGALVVAYGTTADGNTILDMNNLP